MALAGLFSSFSGSKPNANQLILLLISSLFFIIITTTTEAQVVSYGMRKLALSMNQFGLDMLRTIDRMDRVLNATSTTTAKTTPGSFGFCPFCVGSSLAMILAGLKDDGEGLKQGEGQPNIFTTYQHRRASAFESLRHALYLGQMQPQEIHLAFYDLAAHLQLNLPEGFRAKRQAEPAPPEPEKTVSAEIEDMEESIEDSVEHDDDLADDEEEDEEVQLPEWPKFKRSISDSEEEGAEFRTSEASVSSEFAMAEPGDLAEGEFRRSGGSGLFPSLTETTSSSVEMNLLSQVYIQRYLPVDYHYYVLLQYYYKTPIRSLDFAYAPEESRAHINAVVQHLSKEKIREIVGGEGSGSAQKELDSTRLLLLSGLTLQGKLDFRDQVKRRGRRGLTTAFSGVSRNRVQQNSKRPMVMLLGGSSKVQPALLSPSTPLPPPLSSSTPPPSTPSSSSTSANHHTSTSFNPFKPFGPNASRTKESIRLRYSFSSYLNATILEMPFTGGIISFVALVPLNSGSKRNGFESNAMATLLSRLNAQLVVDLVQHLEIRRIDVTMPILKLTHSIAHWNILLSQMGLSALFDPLSAEEADEEAGGDNGGAVSSSQSFAGMSAFPLASVTQLQHQTVIEVGIEDSPSSSYTSGPENSLQNPSTASAGQGGHGKPLQMVVPRPKMRPPKRSLGLNSTRIVRVAKRSSNSEATEVVQSVVMKVLEQRPQQQQQRREPLMSGQSKPISVLKNSPAAAAGLASAKRPHVNLEEEEFIYLVLDNISGLVLAMGKHRPERL